MIRKIKGNLAEWVPLGVLRPLGIDFSSILDRFGVDFEEFGEGLGRVFGVFWKAWGKDLGFYHRCLVIEPTWERFENFGQTVH